MAQTGVGTDECYAAGVLPMPVHFYSPVPDLQDLEQRKVWTRVSSLPGIDMRVEKQLELLKEFEQWGQECQWPVHGRAGKAEFYTRNGSFCYGCAAIAHSMIRHLRPRKILEIGSGNSSLVLREALRVNAKEHQVQPSYQAIDPYPRPEIAEVLRPSGELLPERVECVDLDHFASLRENDILFIDSGHTVRAGSDVNFLYLEVLPRLHPGVVIHIHDISLPDEYPKVYFTNPSFRVFWTEAYLLQAFLIYNSEFEVLFANQLIMTRHAEAFRAAFPHYSPETVHPAISGGFWIRRIPRSMKNNRLNSK
jgi:hypothetical protein